MIRPTLHAPLNTYTLGCSHTVQPPHRMPHFVRRHAAALHLLITGGIEVLTSTGRRYAYAVDQIALSWGAIPHLATITGARNEWWTATFPIGMLLRWDLPRPFVSALLRGELLAEPDAGRGPEDAAQMARWSDDLRRADPDSRRLMLLELEARVRRLARDLPAPARSKKRRTGSKGAGLRAAPLTDKVERMLQLIATATTPLRVNDLADAIGVHPDTASRLFARSVGSGLLAFLMEHRVALAQSLLATSDAKITDIAAVAGFGSVSQFHAVFRKHAGVTPARYRRSVYLDRDAQ